MDFSEFVNEEVAKYVLQNGELILAKNYVLLGKHRVRISIIEHETEVFFVEEVDDRIDHFTLIGDKLSFEDIEEEG